MRPSTIAIRALIVVTMLTGSGGGGGGSPSVSAPGSPNAGGPPTLPSSVTAAYGAFVGSDNMFTPNDGDTLSGGNGQTVDGVPCLPTMADANYHITSFSAFSTMAR